MNLHTPYPYWLLKNGFLFEYPALRHPLKVDFIVMGGGITGALSAWYLAQAGVSVAVVDRRHIGMGSTCASTALLQYEIDVPMYQLAKYVGEKNAARSYHLCIEAIDKLEQICEKLDLPTGFERKPSIYCASRKADLEELDLEFAIRQKHDIRVERWDKADVARAFPHFQSAGALYSPHDGAQVDAYSLTHALLQDAMKHGAQVFDKTEIVDIQHEKEQVVLHTNHGHSIRAKQLVIASGYESQAYLEQKVTRLHSTYALVSEPFDGEIWYRDALIWETARPYLYLRTTSDRRVLIGGRDEPFYSPGRRDKLLNQKTRLLAQDFDKKFPTLAPLLVDFNWAGTFAETADGLPFIGTIKERPRTIFALGFGGNGIVFSQIAGEIIRDSALGKKNPDAHIFSFERMVD
ncbi:MAG: FAD-dependent oxidoreductase [Phycisphaerae bacterium]|nr:FAD-dependent oxidoreductase [Saprospiraceae bacterium]